MTIDELKAKMAEAGFKFQENRSDAFRLGLFWRSVETKRPCTCNERDQIVVEVHDMAGIPGVDADQLGDRRISLTVDVTGDFHLGEQEQWAKLQVYGLSIEEFFNKRLEIEAALIRAWEALA